MEWISWAFDKAVDDRLERDTMEANEIIVRAAATALYKHFEDAQAALYKYAKQVDPDDRLGVVGSE